MRQTALASTAALLVALAWSCAARRPPATFEPPATLDLAGELRRADAFLRAGCYVCLRDAEALYAALARRFPSSAEAGVGRAATVLLLAARARELGIPAPWQDEVDAGLTDVEGEPRLDAYGRVIEQISPPLRVGTPEALDAQAARAKAARSSFTQAERRAMTMQAQSDPVAAHFLVLLACGERTALPVGAVDELPPAMRAIPLVAYAAGACSPAYSEALDEVLEREPRFAEARYHRGVQALGVGALGTADAELAAATAAFPDAPAIHLARGHVHLQLQEYLVALEAFDRVLDIRPDQRDALLGRVQALSHLARHAEAVSSADRLLDLGTWLLGDAYYWRAWNGRQLRQLDAAAQDIDSAKAFLFNADVPKLAGFIAYDRSRFDEARAELDTARERNAGDCDVPFALGLVHARLRQAPIAAGAFAEAARCAGAAQGAMRERLAAIDRTDLSADRKAALRVRGEQALASAIRQEGLATINAARLYASAGNAVAARAFAERAAVWEAHREEANRLLNRLRR